MRTKAAQMIKLLRNEKALHKMRETYKKNKVNSAFQGKSWSFLFQSKFSGVSSEGGSAVRYGGYGGYGGSGGSSRYGGYGGEDEGEDEGMEKYGKKKKKSKKKKKKKNYEEDENEEEEEEAKR